MYFNTNFLTEMKLVPIIMDYRLLQFEESIYMWISNFNFLSVNLQIYQRNRKVHLSICLETNFQDITNISLRDIRQGL